MQTVWVILGIAVFIYVATRLSKQQNEEANKSSDQIVCAHCQTRGSVTVKMVIRGKGISGGKAAGAVATGGLSVFATGLSKNQQVRHMTCSNCGVEWDVE